MVVVVVVVVYDTESIAYNVLTLYIIKLTVVCLVAHCLKTALYFFHSSIKVNRFLQFTAKQRWQHLWILTVCLFITFSVTVCHYYLLAYNVLMCR